MVGGTRSAKGGSDVMKKKVECWAKKEDAHAD